MYLRGMSGLQPGPDSSDSCGGATPCGFTDWFSMSTACAQFIGCSDPSFVQTASTLAANPAVVTPLVIAPLLAAPAVGNVAGQAANAAGTLASDLLSGAGGGFTQSAGLPGMLVLIAVGIGAVLLLPKLVKR